MFILELTDGTTSIDFMSSDYSLQDGGLVITPPEQLQTWSDPTEVAGPQLVDHKEGNRTASITFHIQGRDRSSLRLAINKINDLLHTAILHSLKKTATRVTLKYAWDDTDVLDYFEVLSGKLTLPEDLMSVAQMHGKINGMYTITECLIELVITNTAYGLSPSTGDLIELPLTNRNGNRVLGGIPIADWTDYIMTGPEWGIWRDNYVEINAADIEGDTPGKLRIQITDPYGWSSADRIIIGAHEKISGQMDWHWKDPNLTLIPGGKEFTNAPNYYYGHSIWQHGPIGGYGGDPIWTIKIPDPSLYKNKYYRVLSHTGFFPFFYDSGFPVQLLVRTSAAQGHQELYRGSPTQMIYSSSARAEVLDCGLIQLPPYPEGLTSPGEIEVNLVPAGGSHDAYAWYVNHISLLPVDVGYRVLYIAGGSTSPGLSGIGAGASLVDDGWTDTSYAQDAYGKQVGVVKPQFAPISLRPDKTQRIYFWFTGHDWLPQDCMQYSVRLFYSPAYLGAV